VILWGAGGVVNSADGNGSVSEHFPLRPEALPDGEINRHLHLLPERLNTSCRTWAISS
jgi:hypothetical protein